MRSSYKRLGPYIQIVNDRNTNLAVQTLLGVSIQKILMPSIANTIGTDMTTYKTIRRGQFAYGPVTSRNGDKISIALSDEHDMAMVSQAYTVFEIIDQNELHPEYLMMWFRRPEFDRYARFKSHGSAREIFDWDEMCEVELPIPSSDKQREIVAEYNTVVNRIRLNEQLNQKLEEAAQALYKHWFVNFEFPIALSSFDKLRMTKGDKAPVEIDYAKCYQSSGGKMVWNEELGKEVPEGWQPEPFTEITELRGGGTPSTEASEYWDGDIPFYTPGDLVKQYYTLTTYKSITPLGLSKCSSKKFPRNTTFLTARGATTGGIALSGKPMAMNQTCYAICAKKGKQFFTHQFSIDVVNSLKREAIGATFEALVTKDFEQKTCLLPSITVIESFETLVTAIYEYMLNTSHQNLGFKKMANLILSNMARQPY